MAGFSPFKRHANSFKYTPRYYDPIKEEFEKRREELRGERRDESSKPDAEYTPGQYIRSKRMARLESNKSRSSKGPKRNTWFMVAIIALFFLFASLILPKFVEFFSWAKDDSLRQPQTEEPAWNPHAPITVVPNDYVEE